MLDSARRHPRTTAIGAVLLAGIIVTTLLATRGRSAPTLPSISSRRLVASALRAVARDGPVSGTATVHLDLGLPSLPTTETGPGTGALATLSELSGDHTLRVWTSRDGVRIAELLPAAERAVFATRHALWLWNSDGMKATRVVPAGPTPARPEEASSVPRFDPESLAAKALRAITPSTGVSVGSPVTVAGRAAYPLRLWPRTTRTLVGSVEVDVDGATRIPLRVAVTARGASKPAISSSFDSVSFASIDPSVFSFTPPPGSTVRTVRVPRPSRRGARSGSWPSGSNSVRTFGRGWAAVVAMRIPSLSRIAAGRSTLKQLVRLLPYSGPLLSIRLADRVAHAWVVAGLVPQAALAAIGSRLP